MLAVELRFPGGRYHATPWDQHANEGGVEWPPSPWRFLRALVATWYLKGQDSHSQDLDDLLEALARDIPSYHLPIATGAHTRHYMPIGRLDKGVEKTTKVFDTFIHVSRQDPVVIAWQKLTLSKTQEATLRSLVTRMTYLGRAESWVEAQVIANAPPAEGKDTANGRGLHVHPLAPDGTIGPSDEIIRVLCPMTKEEIVTWRAGTLSEEFDRRLTKKRHAARTKNKDASKVKLSKNEKKQIEAALPGNLRYALEADTGDLKKQGWSRVPGTRWVDYVRPRNIVTSLSGTQVRRVNHKLPTAARFAVASQVPPRLTECLSLAGRVRVALMSRSDAAPVFSGKDEAGYPLKGNHHTFILPEANDRHGRISHVTLYAPMGFDDRARRAMDGLRNVWGHSGHDVQLVLLGVGDPEDFAGMNVGAGQCTLFATSDTWVSRTPFIPTRHAKSTRGGEPKLDAQRLQIGSPEHDLRRLLCAAGFPEPGSIEPSESTNLGGKDVRWLEFKTVRHGGKGARSMNRGFGFRVAFPTPVRGPIAVGYGAHFGMGTFEPETSR